MDGGREGLQQGVQQPETLNHLSPPPLPRQPTLSEAVQDGRQEAYPQPTEGGKEGGEIVREEPAESGRGLSSKGESFGVLCEEEEEREGGRAGQPEGEKGGGRERGGEEGGEEKGAHPQVVLREGCGKEAIAEGGREGGRNGGRVGIQGGDEGETCLLSQERIGITKQEAAHRAIQHLRHLGR